MSFGFDWPVALALLGIVPVAVLWYLRTERRRRAVAAAFGNPALLGALVGRSPGRRRHLPFALALVALALLLLGIARPHADLTKGVEQATVILAIDTSGSMKATDMQPSRLAAARAAANAFIDELPRKYRLGIVSFADAATTVLVPTTDRNAARPAGREAQLAAYAQVPFTTVTLGTGPAVVEVPAEKGLVERVTVAPDPGTLRSIAQTTKGRFLQAPNAAALKEAYRGLGSQLAQRKEPHEVTAAFAGAGAIVLLLGSALSLHWFRRVL